MLDFRSLNYALAAFALGATCGFLIWIINFFPPWRKWRNGYRQDAIHVLRKRKEMSGTELRRETNHLTKGKPAGVLFFYAVMLQEAALNGEVGARPYENQTEFSFFIKGKHIPVFN